MRKDDRESKRVLVVDDEADIGFLMKMLLNAEGYEVIYAQSLDQAKEFLKTKGFRTIFLDLNLDHEFGLDLLPFIKAQNQRPTVVVITAQKDPKIFEQVKKSEVDFLIEKPFDKQKILKVI
jgi:DNA-binding NtrC family response regulator